MAGPPKWPGRFARPLERFERHPLCPTVSGSAAASQHACQQSDSCKRCRLGNEHAAR